MAPPTTRSPKKSMTVSGNFCSWYNSEKKKEYQTIVKPFLTLLCCSKIVQKVRSSAEFHERIRPGCNSLFTFRCVWPQGCSSPIVVKFADTQKDKEQRRLQQQLAQQMQQLNTATWGNLTGLGGLTPQYLAVSAAGWSVRSPQETGAYPLQLLQPTCPPSMPKNPLRWHFESQEITEISTDAECFFKLSGLA